jgi:hypothetical protein
MINFQSFARALVGILMGLAVAGVSASPLPLDTLNSFDFEDQPLGPIGFGGADEGQPHSRSSTAVSATVVDDGAGGQALEVDNSGTSADSVVFQWSDNQNLDTGLVQIRFDITPSELDNYSINIRRAGSAADSYASLRLTEAGNIRVSRPTGTVTIDTYSAGESLAFVLDFNMEAGTRRIRINEVEVEAYTAHGVVDGLGIGRIMLGWNSGANGDSFVLDNLQVRELAPMLTILEADFDDKTVGSPIGTGGAAAGEPVFIPAELNTEIVSLGSGDRALDVERATSGGIPLVEWEFFDDTAVDTGTVVADFEVTMNDQSYLLVRLTDPDGEELIQVNTQPASNPINVRFPDDMFSGTEVGNYVVGTPFRLRLSCQMDDRVCSVAINDDWVMVERPFAPTSAGDFAVSSLRTGLTLLASVGHGFELNNMSVQADRLAGVPSEVSFVQQPTDVPRLDPITPTVSVSVLDHAGDPVSDGTTVNLEPADGFETVGLFGNSATTIDGLASFPDLDVNAQATNLQIVAQVDHPIATPSAISEPFDVLPGRPAVMSYLAQPSDTLTNLPMGTPVSIEVLDEESEPPAAGLEVVLVIADGPAGAVISDNLALTDAAGQVSFPDLTLDTAGDYRLLVTMDEDDFVGEISDWFEVSLPALTEAAFDVQPSETVAFEVMSPAVEISVIDELGGAAIDGTVVTLVLDSGPAATLAGGVATTTGGVAVFDALSIDQLGTFQLRATVDGMPATGEPVSAEFGIIPGPAWTIEVEDQPVDTTAGDLIDPPVTVRVLDVNGFNVADGETVNLAIASGPSGSVLNGTLSQATVDGLAEFNDLQLTVSGEYILEANLGAGMPSSSSGTFTIHPAAPNALVFVVQPSDGVVNQPLTPSVVVEAVDEFDNLVADGETVQLFISEGPVTAGISGNAVTTLNGQASFPAVALDEPGSYQLFATSTGVPVENRPVSDGFDIVAGDPATLSFEQQPTPSVIDEPISPPVSVRVLDDDGFNVADGTVVDLAIASGPSGAVLAGSTTQSTSDGLAVFGDLALDLAGEYVLQVSVDGGSVTETSVVFSVLDTGPDSAEFLAPPTDTPVGQIMSPPVAVSVLDGEGGPVADGTPVVLVLVDPGEATLSGAVETTVDGVALFESLSVNRPGIYQLRAEVSGLEPAAQPVSEPFEIMPGPAASIVIEQQPTDTPAGQFISPPVRVRLVDEFGATLPDGQSVSISFEFGPFGAELGGTLTRETLGGVAVFDDLTLEQPDPDYRLGIAHEDLFVLTDEFAVLADALFSDRFEQED